VIEISPLPHLVKVALPPDAGGLGDYAAKVMVFDKLPQGLIDRRLFCGRARGFHGPGQQLVVYLDIGPHGSLDVYKEV
jgi:hypothetical protein